MLHPFFEGIIIGLTLAVMLGPAVFALIQTSIHRGTKPGIILALGIALSDLTVLVMSSLGAAQLLTDGKRSLIVGLIGGSILIIFGIVTSTRKVHIEDPGNLLEPKRVPGALTYIVKGFFLNIANPFVWFLWFSIMMGVSGTYGSDRSSLSALIGGAVVTIFSTDVLKVLIASRIRHYLTPKILNLFNHAVGILLVVFGIILIIRSTITF